SVAYGSEIALVDAPSAEGYTFSGWSEYPATMPANDVTIEGSFTVNYYTVTYLVDGEVWATESVAYGSEIALVDAPSAEGYTFSGWSEYPATMPANDVTIEGSFTVNYYTVTYLIDGEVWATESVAYGSEIELPYDEAIVWTEETVPSTMPAEDIVITGVRIPTGIDNVTQEVESVVYDLKGNRVVDIENLEQGVYIINGKKVWVK
ncbi:MAG: InlB B-repeat-containing protein, partial [Bacteroidaceae bacterium]|nr:InlB B-repeat-containing protein [Bacteroidaceae bacterium]